MSWWIGGWVSGYVDDLWKSGGLYCGLTKLYLVSDPRRCILNPLYVNE